MTFKVCLSNLLAAMTNKTRLFILAILFLACCFVSFKNIESEDFYSALYTKRIHSFNLQQSQLLDLIKYSNLSSSKDKLNILHHIHSTRKEMKGVDLWLRYLEPLAYKKINGPLLVEWETEVFEKHEKPYKRVGAGLTLAELYLDENVLVKDTLQNLIQSSIEASKVYNADSITAQLKTHHHFYLCNRLFLLNLAAIYTTGFECPDTASIIPELRSMLKNVYEIYGAFNESFPETQLKQDYMALYERGIAFVKSQPDHYTLFDHFTFLKDFVNPLYALNQGLINEYKVSTKSNIDYALNKNNRSIFNKSLYFGQNPKGIFLRVKDEKILSEIDRVGKLLFYDPILSGNNQRSCASCHKSGEYFTDNSQRTSLQFGRKGSLERNTPSLLNVGFNHLIMMDGKHISLQHQTKAVITNPLELGCEEKDIVSKVLSCKEYKAVFNQLLKYTPQEKEVTLDHIVSSITHYYGKFSNYYAPFDEAMNENRPLSASATKGFNLFMGKAQCATCHFIPHFNGVKPSYIGSEFEVLGVPADINYQHLSPDKGRHGVNPADETLNAFRTGTLRNIAHTQPYMHNGVFATLEQVIDFYNGGGGAGRGLKVTNQTLSSDSLRLSTLEKGQLIDFMKSLDEHIIFEDDPKSLPVSRIRALNNRKVGGEY